MEEIMEILEDASWKLVFNEYSNYESFVSDCIDTVINSDLLTDTVMDTETRNETLARYTKYYIKENIPDNFFEIGT